jgi:hypothetical protein
MDLQLYIATKMDMHFEGSVYLMKENFIKLHLQSLVVGGINF